MEVVRSANWDETDEFFGRLFSALNVASGVEPTETLRGIETLINADKREDGILSTFLAENDWNGQSFVLGKDASVTAFLESFSRFLGSAYLKHLAKGSSETNSKVVVEEEKLSISFCADMLYDFLRNIPRGESLSPKTVYFTGSCLLADISGFTKLSGHLCQSGMSGLDSLQVNMRDFIGKIVDIVYSYGGDVITTAGDAIICVFRDEKCELCRSPGGGAYSNYSSTACENALKCSLRIKSCVTPDLTTHCAITYGEMSFAILGGFENKWIYILNGAPISEITSCLDEAGKMEVVVHEKFFSNILNHAENFERTKNGNFRALEVADTLLLSRASIDAIRLVLDAKEDRQFVIERFVPKPVIDAIADGLLDRIAELRDVTTVFISLDNYSINANYDPCSLQSFFEMIQRNCISTGGYLRQFLVDDKGCVAILMWGVPSFSYPNNCSRALVSSASIQILSKGMGNQCSIGITTGPCCCGLIGSNLRQDYVILGASVNLAARLMGKAKGRIILDNSVYSSLPIVTQQFLARIDDLTLKGVSVPTVAYELPLKNTMEVSVADSVSVPQKTIIRRELAHLLMTSMETLRGKRRDSTSKQFKVLSSTATSVRMVNSSKALPVSVSERNLGKSETKVKSVVLHGPSGSGKGTAVTLVVDLAKQSKIQCYRINSESDRQEGYSTIRKVLIDMIGADVWRDKIKRVTTVTSLTKAKDLSATDTQLLRILDGECSCSKADDKIILNLIIAILSTVTSSVLIIENAEYIDEPSWRVLGLLISMPEIEILVIISVHTPPNSRTLERAHSSSFLPSLFGIGKEELKEYSVSRKGVSHVPCSALVEYFQSPNSVVVQMKEMDEIEVNQILTQALKTSKIPTEAVKSVLELSSGIPFWCKSIANYIRDYGSKTFLENVSGNQTKDSLLFLIICRVEKLRTEQQTIIKYASIIGLEFRLNVLSHILPPKLREYLLANIYILEDHRFILKVGSDIEGDTYKFHNKLVQKTVYNLTPQSTANVLHNAIAQFYEEIYAENLSSYSAVISHHYRLGEEDFTRAFKYTVQASKYSLSCRSYNECLVHAKLAKDLITCREEYNTLVSLVNDASQQMSIRSGSFTFSSFKVNSISPSSELDFQELNTEEIQKAFRILSISLALGKKDWIHTYEQTATTLSRDDDDGLNLAVFESNTVIKGKPQQLSTSSKSSSGHKMALSCVIC